MYIFISILLSLIYTLQISCAASSTPALPHKIHIIFKKNTGRDLTELLQDQDACVQGSLYMELLRAHKPYWQLITEIKSECNKKKRKTMWQQLDWQVYQFLTQKREEISSYAGPNDMQNSALKGLVITNALFQQEWLTIDQKTFNSVFHNQIAGSKSSKKRATSASSSTARVPRSSSNRYIHQRGR